MKKNINPESKKTVAHVLELNTYLINVQERADKISDKFVIMFLILGACFAPIYETWSFTIITSTVTVILYSIARFVLNNKFYARMIISLVYGIFMLQFIGQMHGMAEMHFFFFINVALLIIYQDWRIMIPYVVLAILHHGILGVLQANPDIFHLENLHLPNYFIGYNSITYDGEAVERITAFQLFFHFGLISIMACVAGWWAVIFRNNSIQLLEKQLEQQAQNEELQASEEELRQNTEELQSTNNQMKVIQKEIEEKQKLLNRAEKLVGMASYEIDLATQNVTASDNLNLIYGEDVLDNMQKIMQIAHPEDVHKVVGTLTKAAEGKIQVYDFVYRSKGENFSEYKYYRAVGELAKDEMGNPQKLVGTSQDITAEIKQKQQVEEAYQELQSSEEELRQNTEELQTTNEQLQTVQKEIEEKQHLLNRAEKMVDMASYEIDLVTQKITHSENLTFISGGKDLSSMQKMMEMIHPEDSHIVTETFYKIGKGEIEMYDISYRAKREDSVEYKYYRSVGELVRDEMNNPTKIMGTTRDITNEIKQKHQVEEAYQKIQASEEELRQNYEELQTTQEELNLQKGRLEQIFDGVPAMIYQFKMTKDRQLSFPVVSKGSERVYGLSPEVIKNDANSILSTIYEEDLEVFQASLLESAQNMTEWQADLRVVVDGKVQWIRGNSKPVKDDDGDIIWSGITQEITAQKQLEQDIQAKNEELQSSEEELRQNTEELQSTNDQLQVIQKEIEEKQNLLNKAEKLVGLASYEVNLTTQGLIHSDNLPFISGEERLDSVQKVIEIAHPEDVHKVVEILTLAAKGEIQNYDISYRAKGEKFAEYKYYRTIGEVVNDEQNQPEKIVGTIQDITAEIKQKQQVEEAYQKVQSSEEELRQNYEELQTTQEQLEESNQLINAQLEAISTSFGYVEFELNKKVIKTNSTFAEWTEFSESEIIGLSHRQLLPQDEETENYFKKLWKQLKEGKSVNGVFRRKTKSNKDLWIYGAYCPVKNAKGEVIKVIKIASNYNIQKQLEQDIQAKNEELQSSEEELRQNTEELQSTNDQLQVIQKEIEEKQNLLNKAEKLVGLASYEVDLATQKLTHSDNLPFISGEERLDSVQKVIEIAHPEDVHKVVETLTLAAKGEIQNYDISYRAKGEKFAEYKYYRTIGEVVNDEQNQPEKIVGTIQDITAEIKQKQQVEEAYQKVQSSEEELRQNYEELQATQESLVATQVEQEKFVSLIKHFDAFVAITDMEGKIQFLNERGKELSGFGEDYKGRLVSEFHTREYAKVAQEVIIPTVLKKGKWQGEHQLQNQETKKAFETLATVFIIKDPHTKESIALATVQIDITEQKKIEKSIQEQNKKLQASEEELQQNYEELQATQEKLQQQKEEIEKSFLELQTTQSQLIQSEKMASLGQLVANIAHEINTPLGAIRSSAMSIEEILEETLPTLPTFLRDLDDDFLQVFNGFVKQSSQKVDTLSSREKRVIKYDLIDELEAINIEQAEEYADWIVDMNMYKEHDLFIPLLKTNNAKDILHVAYQLSTIIRSNRTVKTATDRAAKIVFALKNFARQDQTGEKAMVNINDSIETTLTLYHNQIKQGIDVTRNLGEIPEFMGYPDELIQVWTNIIHNAIQAMNNNGQLFIQTSLENNNVLISIQDNGSGIPKKVQDRVFDAFFTTKVAGEGSGLGLDITKKIIDKHNGKIWFETEEEVGTTFFIQIPLN